MSVFLPVEFDETQSPTPTLTEPTSASTESMGVDSGVDSEVSPSSPDSAYNKDADSASVTDSIMETAETLLALSGKSNNNKNNNVANVVNGTVVVFPQHPDLDAVGKGKITF